MDVSLSELAKAIVVWIDDRFGRTAAWGAATVAVMLLTIGAVTIGGLLTG